MCKLTINMGVDEQLGRCRSRSASCSHGLGGPLDGSQDVSVGQLDSGWTWYCFYRHCFRVLPLTAQLSTLVLFIFLISKVLATGRGGGGGGGGGGV